MGYKRRGVQGRGVQFPVVLFQGVQAKNCTILGRGVRFRVVLSGGACDELYRVEVYRFDLYRIVECRGRVELCNLYLYSTRRENSSPVPYHAVKVEPEHPLLITTCHF